MLKVVEVKGQWFKDGACIVVTEDILDPGVDMLLGGHKSVLDDGARLEIAAPGAIFGPVKEVVVRWVKFGKDGKSLLAIMAKGERRRDEGDRWILCARGVCNSFWDVHVDVHVGIHVDVHVDLYGRILFSRVCFQALAPTMNFEVVCRMQICQSVHLFCT